MKPPVITFIARSGTGKTTLIEKLIAELKRRGYRVAAIKHDAHDFEIDHEGKDSWRMTKAGADTMLISSATKLAMIKQHCAGQENLLQHMISTYCEGMDIVLSEGFKQLKVPKIEVHRRACHPLLLSRGKDTDSDLIAVASDCSLEIDVPVFNINDACGICNLIVERYLT